MNWSNLKLFLISGKKCSIKAIGNGVMTSKVHAYLITSRLDMN